MEYMIKRALDSGAHGVMTPMCHTAVSPSFSNHPPQSPAGVPPLRSVSFSTFSILNSQPPRPIFGSRPFFSSN